MKMETNRLFLAFGVGLLMIGCSSSSSNDGSANGNTVTDVPSGCAAICAQDESCGLQPDASSCESQCASAALLRPEYSVAFMQALTSCYTGSDCSNVATSYKNCLAKAALDTPSDGADKAFCSSLVTAAAACSVTEVESDCEQTTNIFSDAALQNAQACFSGACSKVPSCVEAALPGYSL
jgi:hypothetical protein